MRATQVATDGVFTASKRSGSADIHLRSVTCPNAAPLKLHSSQIYLDAKCILIAKCAVDQATQETTSRLFVPGIHGLVVFDLFRTFGAASIPEFDYSPDLLKIPGCSLSYKNVSGLCVTDCGKVLTVVAGLVACLILLPDTLVAQFQLPSVPTCLAAGPSALEPDDVLVATATSNCDVHLHRACAQASGLPLDATSSQLGTSARLSSYPISTMAFHSSRPELLVATADGNIHFLSTADASACTSIETLQVPMLIKSAFKAETKIHRAPTARKCAVEANYLCAHAAKVRAAAEAASSHTRHCQAASGSTVDAAQDYQFADSVQTILSLCFVPVSHRNQCLTAGSETAGTDTSHEQTSRNTADVMFADEWRLVAACSNTLLLISPASLQLCGIHFFSCPEAQMHSETLAANSALLQPNTPSQEGLAFAGSNVHISQQANNFTASAAAVAPVCMPCQSADDAGDDMGLVDCGAVAAPDVAAVCVVAHEWADTVELVFVESQGNVVPTAPGRQSGPIGTSSHGAAPACGQSAAMADEWPHITQGTSLQPLRGSPLESAGSVAPGPVTAVAAQAGGPSTATTAKARSSQGAGKRSGKPDQATTFNTRIKSSGYGLTFPKARLGKAPLKPKAAQVHGRASHGLVAAHWGAKDMYPNTGGPPCAASDSRGVLSDAVTALAVSVDGERVAAASSSGHFALLSSGLTGSMHVHPCGHSGQVTSARWSHHGGHLLSSSRDRTVRLWSSHSPDALLTLPADASLQTMRRASGPSPAGPAARRGHAADRSGIMRQQPQVSGMRQQMASAICCAASNTYQETPPCAEFFAMDRLLTVAEGPQVHFYRWDLPKQTRNDVERLKGRATASLVATLPLPSGLRATALACHNSVPSSLVVTATSDCALHLLDAAVGAPVATVTGQHSRAVHTLAVVPVTPFGDAAVAAVAVNAVLSAACDATVLLWDLRCMEVARRFAYDRHASAAGRGAVAGGAAAAAVSPCGQFVACGASDPAAAVLFDMRTSGVLERVVLNASPTCIAFNPATPQMLVGCQDGSLHSFKQ
eukprot:jgi/Ulvmu1/12538/UM090_0025.1